LKSTGDIFNTIQAWRIEKMLLDNTPPAAPQEIAVLSMRLKAIQVKFLVLKKNRRPSVLK
jgi:hypothetical protein